MTWAAISESRPAPAAPSCGGRPPVIPASLRRPLILTFSPTSEGEGTLLGSGPTPLPSRVNVCGAVGPIWTGASCVSAKLARVEFVPGESGIRWPASEPGRERRQRRWRTGQARRWPIRRLRLGRERGVNVSLCLSVGSTYAHINYLHEAMRECALGSSTT